MISNTNLSVRICGIVVACIKVRRELRNGEYTGRNEILFEDPILGFMPLHVPHLWQVRPNRPRFKNGGRSR
jgi:hypothetical protein